VAKETIEQIVEDKFSLMNGFKFGFGFFLANLLGFTAVGLLVWLITAGLSTLNISL
jgi:hypothetical protein